MKSKRSSFCPTHLWYSRRKRNGFTLHQHIGQGQAGAREQWGDRGGDAVKGLASVSIEIVPQLILGNKVGRLMENGLKGANVKFTVSGYCESL